MSLTLHYHPLSSYCWKALIALYELGAAFDPVIVDFSDAASRDAHLALWPVGKIPVLRDEARRETLPEASMIIEYLDRRYPGSPALVPEDPDLAWRARLWDRFFDLHVMDVTSKIITDRIRPAGQHDDYGVEQAREQLARAYDLLEPQARSRTWFTGAAFGLADCAAAPALYYANRVQPLGPSHVATSDYLARLAARPSFARVLEEAAPYFGMFPQG
jgi:glutathione S-transferase